MKFLLSLSGMDILELIVYFHVHGSDRFWRHYMGRLQNLGYFQEVC